MKSDQYRVVRLISGMDYRQDGLIYNSGEVKFDHSSVAGIKCLKRHRTFLDGKGPSAETIEKWLGKEVQLLSSDEPTEVVQP